MEFKPRIFVGSSKEGYDIALKISTQLNDIGECKLWTNAFDLGKSNYENLISQIALYDYAVLVATADDTVVSRHKAAAAPRDNVLFEFGLFAGGLGRSRVFYVVEKNTKIPSDLAGITLPFISHKTDADFEQTVNDTIAAIAKHIKDKESTFDLGFLPSTALAYGYFYNFVERTVGRLLEDRADGKIFHLQDDQQFKIQDIKFVILIPDDLTDDMFNKVKAKRLKDGWRKLKVDPKDVRDYDFSVDVSKAVQGLLYLVDIPFTLNALNKAISLYSQKEHIGKNEKETLLEYREVRNFKRTLDYLILTSSLCKGITTTEIVSI